MSLFVRLALAYAAVGLLGGWALRRSLRRVEDPLRARIVLALAALPFVAHALDTAVRIAPRGGPTVTTLYAVAALAIAGFGLVLGVRWRHGPRLALLPLLYAGLALPSAWILAAVLRRAGEATDAIPLLVYVGATFVVTVAVVYERIPAPRLPRVLGGGEREAATSDPTPRRGLGRMLRALRRLAGRDDG